MRFICNFSVFVMMIVFATSAQAQSWTNQSNMKLKRAEASAVEYNGELFVFNGFSKGLFVGNSVEKYNPSSKKWTLLSTTSVNQGTAVTHTGTVRVGSDVWLLGGRVGAHPGRVTNEVWIYNLKNNKWRKGPKLPKPMAGGGAALVNNKIYMFGGVDAQAKCDVNYNYEYNLGSPSSGWKNLTGSAGMPSARNHFSTVVLNNLIYAIGGQHGHDGCPGIAGGNVALVHTFNPKNKKWNKVANLPKAESHAEPSTFVHNGFIYMAGGNGPGDGVLRYDPKKNKWQQVATLPERLVAPVARIYSGRLVVAGGGAPITSKSKVAVRSLGSSKFKDVAGGATSSDNNTSNNNASNNNTSNNNSNNTNTSTSNNTSNNNTSNNNTSNNNTSNNNASNNNTSNNNTSDTEAEANSPVTVTGNTLSWPDDGWYQVQNENGYHEVCAGVRSCDVPNGSYVVINHSSGARFDGIEVGDGTSSNAANGSGNSPIVVSGNVISWPDNGWYQVQSAKDYSEICSGVASCTVPDGKYNVINHTAGIRYDGIEVGTDFSDLSLEEKVSLFELQAGDAADHAFLNFNQRYMSGSLSIEQSHCIPSQFQGMSIAPVAGCGAEQTVSPAAEPVTQFAYEAQFLTSDQIAFEDDSAECRQSLSNNHTGGCALSSVNLFNAGLYMQYSTSSRSGADSRSIVISDDSLDVSGEPLATTHGSAVCSLAVSQNEISLQNGSNRSDCNRRLNEALTILYK